MTRFKTSLVIAVACAASSVAAAKGSFLVTAPVQVPAAAQLDDAADIFMLKATTARSWLYGEFRGGERLYIPDVTDQERIADIGSVAVAARGAFRFGTLAGRHAVFMDYADGSHALPSFADRRRPSVSEPEGLARASEFDVRNSELLFMVSAKRQDREVAGDPAANAQVQRY